MSDLRPTSDTPGLWIGNGKAAAVCHCGASATAKGDDQVRCLVQGWEANHGPAHQKGTQ
ncbi:hypothetical protein ABT404_30675 [Streptomyces hyaluromycini]|uniref:Uncharacterized protein n=1 Tax=Streptomyces hyaluromycini TaxID=1377993 RepID=A0ABV1X444_9ACTN